jgi:hypothetical protein
MKYTPAAINPDDLDIAEAPYLGGEFAVYLTNKPAVNLGEVELSASGSGAWTASAAAIKTGGADLQCVATTEVRSDVDVVITFNVTNDLSAVTTATATFTAASRAANQTSHFPRHVAVDLVLATGTKIKTITGVASVVGGDRNIRFAVYQLPEAADYSLVGCTTSKKFTTKSRQPKGIDCGMEADAFVKRGKTKPGELSIDSKFGGMHDRLARFDGKKTTAMLVGIKDGVVMTDRLVFAQFVPSVEVDLPDGDGEATENAASGKYVDGLFFTAP